ncbi:MAG: hypothetical protein HYU66_18970 [Armatimonadetes bacterium]|nr:hypothetical protein [Armatimonadota bacterium]
MADIDALLEAARRRFPATPVVESMEWSEIVDTIGEKALWIVVGLSDESNEAAQTYDAVQPIEDAILDELRGAGVTEFPYVRFTSTSTLAREKAA